MFRSKESGKIFLRALAAIAIIISLFVVFVFFWLIPHGYLYPIASTADFSSCKSGLFCAAVSKNLSRPYPLNASIAKDFYKAYQLKSKTDISNLFSSNGGQCKDGLENQLLCNIKVDWKQQANDPYMRCKPECDTDDCLPPCLNSAVINYDIALCNKMFCGVLVSIDNINHYKQP